MAMDLCADFTWQRLGLSFSPFSGQSRPLAYCRVPSVKRLESWLTAQVTPWLIVEGPCGSGKSAFIQHWMRRHKGCCVRFVATEGLSVPNFTKKLRIDCPSHQKDWSLSTDMAHIRYVLIDDAHRLSQETLTWLQNQAWPQSLQLIFFTECKPAWSALSASSYFNLSPWSLDDIGYYCMKRLRQAGWQADLPILRRSVLNTILKETQGWVASLDQAIATHWSWSQKSSAVEASRSRLQIRATEHRMPSYLTPRLIASVLLASLLLFFLVQGTGTPWQSFLLASDVVVDYLIHLF